MHILLKVAMDQEDQHEHNQSEHLVDETEKVLLTNVGGLSPSDIEYSSVSIF